MRLNFYITFNTVKRLIIYCCRLQRGLSLVWNILVIVALRFGKPCNLESTIYCYLTGNTGGGGGGVNERFCSQLDSQWHSIASYRKKLHCFVEQHLKISSTDLANVLSYKFKYT